MAVINRQTLFDPKLWDAVIDNGVRILAIILGAWLLHRLIMRFIRLYRRRTPSDLAHTEQARRTETLARVFRNLSSLGITMIAVALILKDLGISAAPIVGAAGVLGLALGFGAQSLMKDFVAGFFLLLENQVARGDVVDIAGKTGTVEDVRLRFVQLRDYEGNVHFIPNGLITTVTNMSRGFAYAVIEVGVVHGTDISQVYESLRAVAKQMQADPAYKGSIEDEIEITGIERMDGSGVTVRSRLRVRPLEQWRVRREFLHRLRPDFDRREIKLLAPPVLASR
jgi:moderate conductance mechanosensitive channel